MRLTLLIFVTSGNTSVNTLRIMWLYLRTYDE
jgi:hypothetical protein